MWLFTCTYLQEPNNILDYESKMIAACQVLDYILEILRDDSSSGFINSTAEEIQNATRNWVYV